MAVPESVVDGITHKAMKEGRWIEAWERLLKALGSFDERYYCSYNITELVNDATSNVVSPSKLIL